MTVEISPIYLQSYPPADPWRKNSPLSQELEQLARENDSLYFRYSRKGAPHLVKLGEHQAYSIGYFKKGRASRYPKGDFWRVFFPYGVGAVQDRRDFDSAEEVFQFIDEKERKNRVST